MPALAKKKLPTKADKCTDGWSCGKACISKKKVCRKSMLNRQALNVAKGFWQLMNTDVKDVAAGVAKKFERQPPSASFSEEQKATLKSFEDSYRMEPYESAALVNNEGERIFISEGDPELNKGKIEVGETFKLPEDVRRNSVLTHNHPMHVADIDVVGTITADGGAFSPEDFVIAAKYNFGAVRAVTEQYNYTLKPKPGEKWPKKGDINQIANEFDAEFNRLREDANAMLEATLEDLQDEVKETGKMPSKADMKEAFQTHLQAGSDAIHEAWEYIANKHNLDYTREEYDKY